MSKTKCVKIAGKPTQFATQKFSILFNFASKKKDKKNYQSEQNSRLKIFINAKVFDKNRKISVKFIKKNARKYILCFTPI